MPTYTNSFTRQRKEEHGQLCVADKKTKDIIKSCNIESYKPRSFKNMNAKILTKMLPS